jgi:hypothetical protein
MSFSTIYLPTTRASTLVRRAGPTRYARLANAGWTFAESEDVEGSAHANPYTRQIVFKPKVTRRQSKRDIYYVAEHEVGHALDFEAGTPSLQLSEALGLNHASAQEALAEAVAYWSRKSSSEKTWILTAIAWHVKASIRWRYSWRHVRHPSTIELADLLVKGPGSSPGVTWAWQGDKIVTR